MKDYDARVAGFLYTGMCCQAWRAEEWAALKAKADLLKKTYKGADYRVVNESCMGRFGKVLYKNIYGNEIFRKVQYFNPEADEAWLNTGYDEQRQRLQSEYECKLRDLEERRQKVLENYRYLMGLRKK